MNLKVKRFTDEFKLMVVQEYLSTDLSQDDLKRKYHFGGAGNIPKWMRKFGLTVPSPEQIIIQTCMAKEIGKTSKEKELETRIKQLEMDLEYEKLRVHALDTIIDIAERNLKIAIRKKSGAKQ